MSGRSPARRPAMKLRVREAAATAILEAAEQVAAARGLDATSTAAIAERAGVAVGTLYNYFPDRETLLASLFKLRRAEILPRIQAAEAAARGLEFEPRLRRYLTEVIAVFEDFRQFIRVSMLADPSSPYMKQRPQVVLETVTTALADILRPVVAERSDDYARMLFGATKALLGWRVEHDQPMGPDAALLVDTFLRGIAAR